MWWSELTSIPRTYLALTFYILLHLLFIMTQFIWFFVLSLGAWFQVVLWMFLWGEYASSLCFLHLLFVPQNWANLSLFLFIFPILCFHIILSLFLLFWPILAFMPPISTLIFFFGVLANMCCNFSWYVNNLLFSQISWYIALHGGKIEAFSFKSHNIFFYLQITNPGDCFFYLQITIPADCLLLSWTIL